MKPFPHYIFGYGSLVNLDSLQSTLKRKNQTSLNYHYGYLENFTRIWNVGMDNSIHIENYKHYLDPNTQERPNVFVTFLNIQSKKDSNIQGIVFEVTPSELKQFDTRERNYSRVDVSNSIDLPIQGTVWAYIGLPESIRQFNESFQEGRAVISSTYHDLVTKAFGNLNSNALKEFEESTVNPGLSLKKLKVIRHG